MKSIIYISFVTLLLVGCSTSSDANFIIKGEIIGLKKGTVYLEKVIKNQIVALDSVFIDDATEQFTFTNNIKEPEIFIISLDKSNEQHFSFFGEPGEINVKTKLDDFFLGAKITGSQSQKLIEKHDEYVKKFSDQNLDLIKERLDALKQGNQEKVNEIEEKRLQNLKRRYLFSANFAIANNDKAIAPYIAYAKMEQASPKLKQKIYDALEEDIKKSKYGLLLYEVLNPKE